MVIYHLGLGGGWEDALCRQPELSALCCLPSLWGGLWRTLVRAQIFQDGQCGQSKAEFWRQQKNLTVNLELYHEMNWSQVWNFLYVCCNFLLGIQYLIWSLLFSHKKIRTEDRIVLYIIHYNRKTLTFETVKECIHSFILIILIIFFSCVRNYSGCMVVRGWRANIIGSSIAFHTTNPGSIPNAIYGPQSTSWSDPDTHHVHVWPQIITAITI